MTTINPENLDDNTDSAYPQKSSDLLENTVNLNTNYKEKYIGDFVECKHFSNDEKKIYYPYELFIRAFDDIALYRQISGPTYSSNYSGKDLILDNLSYGDKELVSLWMTDKDLTLYLNKNGVGKLFYLTKYSGELDITLDEDGNRVYTLKKIDSFIDRFCDKFGSCFRRSSKKPPAGGSKKRAKKTRKQRKHRNLKRNHKK